MNNFSTFRRHAIRFVGASVQYAKTPIRDKKVLVDCKDLELAFERVRPNRFTVELVSLLAELVSDCRRVDKAVFAYQALADAYVDSVSKRHSVVDLVRQERPMGRALRHAVGAAAVKVDIVGHHITGGSTPEVITDYGESWLDSFDVAAATSKTRGQRTLAMRRHNRWIREQLRSATDSDQEQSLALA